MTFFIESIINALGLNHVTPCVFDVPMVSHGESGINPKDSFGFILLISLIFDSVNPMDCNHVLLFQHERK